MLRIVVFALVIAGLGGERLRAEEGRSEEGGPRFAPLRAQANWNFGQIEKGYYWGESREFKELFNQVTVWTQQELEISEQARAFLGVGGAYFLVFPRNLGRNPYSMSKRSGFGITDAHGELTLLKRDENQHGLLLKAGIFPYKYNPDAKNLGEYMFRTWTYPTIITGGGLDYANSAGAQLSGLSGHSRLGGMENEILLTFQTERAPVMGLSLTDIVSYSFGDVLTLGAGFMFDNFYTAEKESSRPTLALGNQYYTLSNGEQMASREYSDRLAQGLIPAGATIADTAYYTFVGQKAMLRASLDIGNLIDSDQLSADDLRIYFEAILMGIRNYPTYYENRLDRTALLVGMNLPTFRWLDLLSVEAEFCPNPFENSTRGPYGEGLAAPYVSAAPNQFPAIAKEKGDDLKWTVQARKRIFPGFSIHAQVASDHIKTLDVYSTPDFYDILIEKDHWYWVLKLVYAI